MNLFFSAGNMEGVEFDERIRPGTRYRLMSCHGAYLRQAHVTSRELAEVGQPFELMYDSGAFTAWSQGKEVDIDELIAMYDEMMELYSDAAVNTWFISLDKIPGERGRTASPAEIEEACRISDVNFAILQKRYGHRVLPVFHQNETTPRLHEVAAMAPYICVSPRNDLHEASRRAWSAEVHALIPGKKTHGLAATGYSMMTQVPWGSVDSATWVLLAANGAIFLPGKLKIIQVSDQSSSIKDKDQHLRTLSHAHRIALEKEITDRGFTIKELESDFMHRMAWNRVLMTEVYEAIPPQNVVARRTPVAMSLFDL